MAGAVQPLARFSYALDQVHSISPLRNASAIAWMRFSALSLRLAAAMRPSTERLVQPRSRAIGTAASSRLKYLPHPGAPPPAPAAAARPGRTPCCVASARRSECLPFRYELEESSSECRRIGARRVMKETRKAHLLSSRHAFADTFIDQLVECARFLALRDQRGPSEGLQFIACHGGR
jgi:hypothetical protein